MANKDNSTNDDDILSRADELLGMTKSDDSKSAAATGKPLPATAAKFQIPTVVREKYPKLIQLILETESMDDKERDYWFQILPIMTLEQVKKLRDILVNEKEQLAKLDAEYEKNLEKINRKHLEEWREFESRQRIEEIEKAERKEQMRERNLEEELLRKLQEL